MHETISEASCQASSWCRTAAIVDINPAYTSQTCDCCLHLGLRNNKSFKIILPI